MPCFNRTPASPSPVDDPRTFLPSFVSGHRSRSDQFIMYPSYVVLFVLAYHVSSGTSLPATTYDQRQTGDLNVQVHVKDVQVLALLDSELLDDYTEYDYFYDYADFTVKPIVKPTTSTTTTEATPPESSTIDQGDISEVSDSSSQNSTSPSPTESSIANFTIEDAKDPVPVDAEKTNQTLAVSSTEHSENSTSDGSLMTRSRTRINDKNGNLFEDDEKDATEQNGGDSTTLNPSKGPPRKQRCRSGYSPNGKGRCRRLSQRRLSLIPLAVRLAPKLFDDPLRGKRNLAQEENDRTHSN